MKKFLLLLAVLYIAIVTLMPKENLYYTLKNRLKDQQITISESNLKDNLISLKADNVIISYDGIESVDVESFSILPLILYNKLTATNVSATDALKSMFKYSADEVVLTYKVWDYRSVDIVANGDFGEIHGSLDIFSGELKLNIEPSLEFEKNSLLRQYFKESDEGYIHESKIY